MYNALELRSLEDKPDIDFLQRSLGFELPNMYKFFIEAFQVGDGKVRYEKFLNPENDKIVPCVSVQFLPFKGGKELFFNGLFSIEELISDWKSYTSSSKEWQNYGMLRIADIGVGGGLFLGIKDSMRDKIYRVVWDWDEDYEFVANDILEYYKGLGVDEDFSNMRKYKYSQLYKNWGEDFWRVRE
jgi:hypothetical protein